MSASSFHKQRPCTSLVIESRGVVTKFMSKADPFFIENGTLYESILKLTLSLLEVIDM